MSTLRECLIDFETASGCDLKKAGAFRYAEDVTTEILCASFSVNEEPPVTWRPTFNPAAPIWRKLLGLAIDPNVTFIAHNAQFEKAEWRAIMVPFYGFPDIPDSRWHCTMASAAMRVIPLDLDRCVQTLRLPHAKDTEGSKLVRSLSKPLTRGPRKGFYPERTPEVLERIYAYCESDVEAEWPVHRRLGYLPPGERKIYLLDQTINQRGLRLDLPFIKACQTIVDKATVPLAAEFKEITGGLTFTQAVKIGEWVRGQGVVLPNLQKETLAEILGLRDDEEDGDDETEDRDVELDLPAGVRRALEIRQLVGSAAVKKLPRMEACVCADGLARGLLQYHAAGPGRWGGRLFQPQNFPRGTLKLDDKAPPAELLVQAIMTGDPDWVSVMFGASPVATVISALRHAIIAKRGRLLVAGDFAQIEARVVLALAGQWDKIAVFQDKSKDIYNDMATDIYGRPIDRKNGDAEEGQTGKNAVLGLGFGMGAAKFQLKYAKSKPLDFAKGVVDTYRQDWAPEVPKLWRGLERAACDTVWKKTPHEAYGVRYELREGWLTARLPSGRLLWYWNPQPVRRAMPWDDTDIRPSWTYEAMKAGRMKTIDAFGGLLAENCAQALARDIMCAAMFRCEANGFPVGLTVHDEIVTEPETANADHKALEQIMADNPPWVTALRIPVKAEGWTGERYKK